MADMKPPAWLGSEARKHFEVHAAFMAEVNDAAGFDVYGEADAATLAKMAASHQKAMEYMVEEQGAKSRSDADRAQRKRLSEEKSYQSYMRLLRLDPEGRAEMRARYAKRVGGFYWRTGDE